MPEAQELTEEAAVALEARRAELLEADERGEVAQSELEQIEAQLRAAGRLATPEPPGVPERPTEAQETQYVILQATDEGFKPAGQATARGRVAAVQAIHPADGDYKAVPLRSWKTIRVGSKVVEPQRVVEEVED